MSRKIISAEEFDRLFDEGSDEIDDYIDWSKMRRPGLETTEPVNVELPAWMGPKLDEVAAKAGMSRQALLESWITAEPGKAA